MRTPRLRRLAVPLGVAAVLVAVLTPPAFAQATRTWVSGVGDDANPCSRTAPCKTFAGAISKTATGGIIDAMDDGGYGTLTITKSITIDGGGHAASVLAGGTTNGITINAPADADVVLRGLDITGAGSCGGPSSALSGLQLVGARSVRVDDVTISQFQQAVNTPLTNSSADIFVDMALNHVDVSNNCVAGLMFSPDAGHRGRVTIDGTTVTGSNVAISVGPGAEAWVSDSRFYLNNVGVQSTGGPIHSLCNNTVAGNASDGSFTDASNCGPKPVTTPVPAPTAAPPTAAPVAPAYCTVPKLKGRTSAQAATLLRNAGCSLGKVTKQKVSKEKLRKKVVSQAIPAAVKVKQGTAVRVVVGR